MTQNFIKIFREMIQNLNCPRKAWFYILPFFLLCTWDDPPTPGWVLPSHWKLVSFTVFSLWLLADTDSSEHVMSQINTRKLFATKLFQSQSLSPVSPLAVETRCVIFNLILTRYSSLSAISFKHESMLMWKTAKAILDLMKYFHHWITVYHNEEVLNYLHLFWDQFSCHCLQTKHFLSH